ncbi:type II secretion system F family protein [Pontibacterium sp.]|uniref:type II secretion system F family protein n=1 Tax=Pontibacterium sp. TaxID=2036026 RepID=UPI003518BAB6
MPLYQYRAVTAEGESRSGALEGTDEQSVVHQLQGKGLIPISIEMGESGFSIADLLNTKVGRRGLSDARLLIFTQQLSALMQAGIALDRALDIMYEVSDDPQLLELVQPIQDGVRRGLPLSRVLADIPDTFSHFYVSMVQAAEVSGDLGSGLDQLSIYLERSKELRDRVLSALIYPIILVIVAAVCLLIILTYVVPQFQTLFADMGQALPLSTAIVITAAEGIRDYFHWGLLILIAALLYWRHLLSKPDTRLWWDRKRLSMPLIGAVSQRVDTARFSRSLGTLVQGGVPLLSALGIARETIANTCMARAVDEATKSLKEGKHLAGPLQATGLFPSLALQMIQVGEETGQLESMLLKVADVYDREVSTAIQRALSILTPVLIVGLGILIAGIIMSILVAIMSINDIPI